MPGPAPKKHARYGVGKSGWVTLPGDGRRGSTPDWPFGGRTPAGWVDLWRLPQAVMWEQQRNELVVARYLVLRKMTEQPESLEDVNAAALSEVRQLEDRLGLTPMALKRLQWEIGEVRASDKKSKVVDARDRFTAL